MKHNIALIGFGTVGQGLCEILVNKKASLNQHYGFEFDVVAVSDIIKGSVYCKHGLDIAQLLKLAASGTSLNEYVCEDGEFHTGWDATRTIRDSGATVVCELTYTNIETGEPAITHVQEALTLGKHVVTSNKGPAALAYRELTNLARQNGIQFLIEGTVMSGTPIIKLAKNELAGNNITAIQGILNGTTNFILTRMEKGQSYEDALREAQQQGYAEADPTADVEGWDALAKVATLATVVMGGNLKPDDIPCQGISHLALDDIRQAKREGKRWKLIGAVKKEEEKVVGSVAPQMVDLSHPLAQISGATNAITFSTDLLGDVTVVGPGAGREATGFALLSDLLEIHRLTQG